MSTRAAGDRGDARADPGRGKRGIHARLVRRRDAARHRGGRRSCAADAGNHFAGKEELFAAAAERIGRVDLERPLDGRGPATGRGAIATLVDDYERNGRFRTSARSPSRSASRPSRRRSSWVARGHQEWVEHVFAAALQGLRGAARKRRVAQLVAATDVYTWKLLRRDKGLSRDQTITAIRELVEALAPPKWRRHRMTRSVDDHLGRRGHTPPMMSVARALVERGHDVRVLADPLLRADVEAAGAEHVCVDARAAPRRPRPAPLHRGLGRDRAR